MAAQSQPLEERYLDVIVVLVEQLGWLALVLAIVGGYGALRDHRLRQMGVMWLLIGAGVLVVRPWLGPVRGNPDSMGYLIAGYCAVAAFATIGAGALLALSTAVLAGSPMARAATLGLCVLAVGHSMAQSVARRSCVRLDRCIR